MPFSCSCNIPEWLAPLVGSPLLVVGLVLLWLAQRSWRGREMFEALRGNKPNWRIALTQQIPWFWRMVLGTILLLSYFFTNGGF